MTNYVNIDKEEKLTRALNLWDLEDAINEIQNNMVKMEHEIKILQEEKEKLLTGSISSKLYQNPEDICCTS